MAFMNLKQREALTLSPLPRGEGRGEGNACGVFHGQGWQRTMPVSRQARTAHERDRRLARDPTTPRSRAIVEPDGKMMF